MAEEKSRLDKFRDLYLPTVREYEKKLADTLSYYAGPELTKIGQGIRALLPFQNIPDLTPVVKDPSLKNIGKFASDVGITTAELFPPTLIASKIGTAPGKVAQEVTSGIKPVDDIINKKIVPEENLEINQIAEYQKLADAKGRGGKVLVVGDDTTEGTFRYKGKTYNKSDGVRIGYSSKRRDFEKQWIPKDVYGKPTISESKDVISIKKGQEKGLETKRMQNINEYYPNLQKEMLENNLTIDEAIVKLAGKDLPKGTKSYQIVDKFYRLSDDMKNVNPKMHQFFENEIKAYQIQNYLKGTRKGDKFTGEKVRFGTKEYEAARKELAEKLNIDVKFIDRAHSIMKSRLNKLSKLVDEGTITNEQAMKLSKPQYFLLNSDNLTHVKLENKLDTLLQRKKNYLDEKDFTSANKVQEGIEDITKEMEELGVESELFDPVKKLIKVFGRRPDTVEIYKKAKETGIKKKDGGMVGISHLTRPL